MIWDLLTARRLLVVMGKGGVGKSALAAVLGRCLARRGRRTLALEVEPRESLHQLLDVPPTGGAVVAAGGGLYLQNLKPKHVVDWVVERQVKIGPVVRRVLASPVYQRFVEGAPGLTEIAVLGHVLRLVRGHVPGQAPFDTVVLDAPATGHGIYLLTAARLYAETIGEGPFADLARDVAGFVADAQRTGLVVVTQAEEMPVQEALELRSGLTERFGRGPDLLLTNGLYPPFPADLGDGDEASALWRRRRRLNERELGRLERCWEGPKAELPLLPLDRGPELLAALAEHLETEAAWT